MDFFEQLSEKKGNHDIVNSIIGLPSNYVGSKRRMLFHILDILEKHEIKYESVFDPENGTL